MTSKKWRVLEFILIACLLCTLFLPWMGNTTWNYSITTAPEELIAVINTVANRWEVAKERPVFILIPALLAICTLFYFTIGTLLILAGIFTYLSGKNRKYIFRRKALIKWAKTLLVLLIVVIVTLSTIYSLLGGRAYALQWELVIPCVLMIVEHFVHKKLSDEELNDQWRVKQMQKK